MGLITTMNYTQMLISIKTKSYNHTGGKCRYSIIYADAIGRVIKWENYIRKHLLLMQKIVYDDNNNWILDIHYIHISIQAVGSNSFSVSVMI